MNGISVINWRYLVFKSPNGDGKIQFLIENTKMTVFIQKFDYRITAIFEKINGSMVIQNLVQPPRHVPNFKTIFMLQLRVPETHAIQFLRYVHTVISSIDYLWGSAQIQTPLWSIDVANSTFYRGSFLACSVSGCTIILSSKQDLNR